MHQQENHTAIRRIPIGSPPRTTRTNNPTRRIESTLTPVVVEEDEEIEEAQPEVTPLIINVTQTDSMLVASTNLSNPIDWTFKIIDKLTTCDEQALLVDSRQIAEQVNINIQLKVSDINLFYCLKGEYGNESILKTGQIQTFQIESQQPDTSNEEQATPNDLPPTPTPTSIETVVLPDNWSELSMVEKIRLNPYQCLDTTQIRSDNGRCLSGGSALEEAVPVEEATSIPTVDQETPKQEIPSENDSNITTNKGTNRSGIAIIAIIVILVLVVTALIFFFYRKQQAKDDK